MNESERTPAKWLRFLLYIELVGFVLSLLAYLTAKDTWNIWAQRLLEAGSIYCLFRLVQAGLRYRKAAILHALKLGLTLVSAGLSAFWFWQMRYISAIPDTTVYNAVSQVLTTVIMVVSWVATWQLYHAHGELVPQMAKKWHILFFLTLLAGLILSLGSGILASLRMDGQMSQELYGKWFLLLQIPGKLVQLLSMAFLLDTIRILEKKEA